MGKFNKKKCIEDACNNFLLQNNLTCAKICNRKINLPIADFGKTDVDVQTSNYPIPIIVKNGNEFSGEDSFFTDGCANAHSQRQFRWSFYDINGVLIHQTPFQFGAVSFIGGTYSAFDAGEDNYDLLVYLSENLSGYEAEIGQDIYVFLHIIDCNGIQSGIFSNTVLFEYVDLIERWSQLTLDSYLLINEHVDSNGNDIAGRTLTSDQKQYIFNRLGDTLAPRFHGSSASIVQRTPAQMADAFYYTQRFDPLATTTFRITPLNSAYSFAGTVDYVFDNQYISHNSEITPAVAGKNILIVSNDVVGNEFGNSQMAFIGIDLTPIVTGPIWNYRQGELSAFIGGLSRFTGLIPSLPQNSRISVGGNSIINQRFSGWVNDDTILRAVKGISILRCLFTEAKLKEMIDIVHANRFNLVAGSTYDFRANTGSAAVAADPVYVTLLNEIASDGNVSVSI